MPDEIQPMPPMPLVHYASPLIFSSCSHLGIHTLIDSVSTTATLCVSFCTLKTAARSSSKTTMSMFAKITDYVFGPSSEGNDPDNHPDTNASTTTTTTKRSFRTDREVIVTSLHVFPIKSCRGISIDSSHVVARGLEFDREWAIREVESRKIITAREYPQVIVHVILFGNEPLIDVDLSRKIKALRIVPRLDFENNVMVVSFPPESGLAGFSVRLRADEDEIRSWERYASFFFKQSVHVGGYVN